MKLRYILIAAMAVFCNATAALAQSSSTIGQSQFDSSLNTATWSLTWGSDSIINPETNGISMGVDSSPMIAGGSSYTSDVLSMALTFNGGNISVTANSASAPGDFWIRNYSINSTDPIMNILFGAIYQADNNETLSIYSVFVDGAPLSGSATVNGSQAFSGFEVSYPLPITSLNFNIGISTPLSTWERQNPITPPYIPALQSIVVVPGSVPEPSTIAFFGISLIAVAQRFRKKSA